MQPSVSNFLETADFIGAKLCRDAMWAGQRCNWFGVPVTAVQRSVASEAQGICGPDLYSGTSGIAIFLARLFAATGEKIFRMTAEAAIRQALSRLDHFPPDTRVDFYKGLTGVAYSLFETAESCGIEKFNEMGLLIMEDVAGDDSFNDCSDPATVPALLRMHQRYQTDFLLQLATKCGDELRNRSGVNAASAMLELFGATGEKNFRQAAEAILLSDPVETTTDDSQTGRAYLRAFELLGDDNYAARAREVTKTVRSRIQSLTDDVDFSLPRGLAAAADLLLEAGRVLGEDDWRRTAERVGNWGIERYSKDDLPWPCGSTNGWDAPSFMHGLAGIGYFYLRLHDSVAVPSVVFGL